MEYFIILVIVLFFAVLLVDHHKEDEEKDPVQHWEPPESLHIHRDHEDKK